MNRFLYILIILIALSTKAFAGLNEGMAAFKSKDFTTALRELTPIADNGDPSAQHAVGQIYEFGLGGTQKNPALAVSYYQKAADQGFAGSQLNLGTAYLSGMGVVKDYEQARQWWQKAADQGESMASHNLAFMYSRGIGVTPDFPKAVLLYRKAIEGGNATSVFNLGVIYANGAIGVPRDLMMAYVVFSVAAPNDGGSIGYKGIVGARLTADQLQKARLIAAPLKLGSPLPIEIN